MAAILSRPQYVNMRPFCFSLRMMALRQAFQALDADGSGFIEASDIQKLVKDAGIKDVQAKDIDELIKEVDTSGDGKVSFEEFATAIGKHMEQQMGWGPGWGVMSVTESENIILTKFSSLAVPEVVKMTTSDVASDENFVNMPFPFQCVWVCD